ncbi:MAG TPA: ABC transporter permease subunit [Gammaproteobacteria bacterium]|nr:ABC transporter permease subunit [Gammaproteobacteria bacterium]
MSDRSFSSAISAVSDPAVVRRRRWRMFKDSLARYGVALGGISVILAIVLIFFYLLLVVFPLFESAEAEAVAEYARPGSDARTLHLAMEEQAEIAVRFSADGAVDFFSTVAGGGIKHLDLAVPATAEITSFAFGDPTQARVAVGFNDGTALVARHVYQVSYPNDVRTITPDVVYPLGSEPLEIDDEGEPLVKLAMQDGEEEATIVAVTVDGRLLLNHFLKEEDMFGDEINLERHQVTLPLPEGDVQYLLLDKEQRNLYVATSDGSVSHFDVTDKENPSLVHRQRMVDMGQRITSLQFLTGDISLLVGDDSGHLVQWFGVQDERGNTVLRPIRQFTDQHRPISNIVPEYTRKGFLAADESGLVAIYHTTAERLILKRRVAPVSLTQLAIAPHANAMLAEDASGKMYFWRIHNEHPEISWSSLWGKVWYESYNEPVHAWQSSSASDDFEPKLSITPLVFGTIKAAFYAMLLAVPLAIMGAIYTAYFMAPRMRGIVKPSIETMEALPTVILGFLAGLWLAPLIEANLPGIFSLLVIVPFGVLLFAFIWNHAPKVIRHSVPEGWDAALLIPVVLLLGWLSMSLSAPMEYAFFGGDMRAWLSNEMGVDFDQRNSLVVGLAMGFAVIPTIFSITEDAIFSVPKHLTLGSLALGATPWQTLVRVVILTASPGIFSAVMIGMGRAVGETMIVLMATGNTPVMDFSVFQGMRTLSANIAVEMPEAEVDSTHYRVLFLAALVLFAFTFIFNTLAELVRQNLRNKYSSL